MAGKTQRSKSVLLSLWSYKNIKKENKRLGGDKNSLDQIQKEKYSKKRN